MGMGGGMRSVGSRMRAGVPRAFVLGGLLVAMCGLARAGAPADSESPSVGDDGDGAVAHRPCPEPQAEAPEALTASTAPLLTPRELRQERQRWRQALREQPLWTVARARYGRGEAPQIISRLDDDPTQATQVRQDLAGGASYTSTWLLGAFSMWSRLTLPALPTGELDGLVSDVQSALAAGQQWQSVSLADGSRSYQTADLSAAFRLLVTPDSVVIDTHDAVVSDDVVWRVASGLFAPDGPWTVTERIEERDWLPALSVGAPEGVEQSFAGGIQYRRHVGAAQLSIPSAQPGQVSSVVAALMDAQAPSHAWGAHPWDQQLYPGERTFYATAAKAGDVMDTERHPRPFWVYQRGSDVEIWLAHPKFMGEPLWWHLAEHVAPAAPPTVTDNGWLGDVTDDHRVGWSGNGGRSCQVFSHGFAFCEEVDPMSPLAMLFQDIAFPQGQDDVSRAILSELVAETSDGAAWRPMGLTEQLLQSCQVSVDSTGLDVYCSNGIEVWLSGEPF